MGTREIGQIKRKRKRKRRIKCQKHDIFKKKRRQKKIGPKIRNSLVPKIKERVIFERK